MNSNSEVSNEKRLLFLINGLLVIFLVFCTAGCDELLTEDGSSSGGNSSLTLDGITEPPSVIGGNIIQGYISDLSTDRMSAYSINNDLSVTFPAVSHVKVDGYLEIKGTYTGSGKLAVYVEEPDNIYGQTYTVTVTSGSFSYYIYFDVAGEFKVTFCEGNNYYNYFSVTNVPSANIEFLTPTGEVQAFDGAIMAKAIELYRSSPSTSSKDLAKTIHDYVVKATYYDYDSYNDWDNCLPQDAVSVMQNGKAVCQGYSCLYAALLRACGLPVSIASGDDHAWNRVYWDKVWHNVDTTWDDPGDDGSSDLSDGSNLEYTYFDISDGDLAADHSFEKVSPYLKISKK